MKKTIAKITTKIPLPVFVLIFTLLGLIILSLFATLQKAAIGSPLILEGYLVPVSFGGISGALIGYLFLRLEQSRRSAIDLANNKGKFLANISHEVRTPLNGIVGLVDLLEPNMDQEKFKHFKEIILYSTDNLVKVLNDILDFSRIESGQIELKESAVMLNNIVLEPLGLLSALAEKKNLQISAHIDNGLDVMVLTDGNKLKQIMINLINNAIKFTEKGYIKINLLNLSDKNSQTDSLHIRFIIEDTGIGIPTNKLNDIFSPFAQVATSQTTRHHGAGLGLTIANNLIKLFHSKINVESTEGKGTIFHFDLNFKKYKRG